MKRVQVGNVLLGNDLPFVLIGGPCAIESGDHALYTASEIKSICDDVGIQFIYKSSFDKANRSSIDSARGIGMLEGLEILAQVRTQVGVPVVTDVHLPDQCETVSNYVDMLQIPAFLCRQTDLLVAAAKTGKPVHVKKGQFVAPEDMSNIAAKISKNGNNNILLCDRGTFFGYHSLVSDFKCLPIMAKTGYPVVFDATHSIQEPSVNGSCSGGNREFAPILARAAVAIGASAIYMETHENPDVAPCDGPNMVRLDSLRQILLELKELDIIAKKYARFV